MGNPILAQAAKAQGSLQASYDQLGAAAGNQVIEQDEIVKAVEGIGANNVIIESAKNTAALQTQNARLKAGAAFGADLNNPNEVITGLAQTASDAYNQRMASLKKIQEKDSVSFMDNPIGYLMAQFSINDDIRQANAASQIQDAAQQEITRVTAESSAVAQNQSNFTQTLTQAAVDAAASNTALLANKQAAEERIKSLGYAKDALNTAINADKEVINYSFQMQGAQNAQAQLGLAMANYQLHKDQFQWQKDKQGEGDEYIVDRMQKGLITLYGDKAPNLKANPKLAASMVSLLKSNTPAGKEANDAFLAGQSGIIAGDPASMIGTIASGTRPNFTPAQQPIKSFLDSVVQDARKSPTPPTNKEEANRLVNGIATTKIKAMQAEVKPGDGENMFQIGSLNNILAMPGVADQPLTKILTPVVAAGGSLDNPDQVWQMAVKAVKENQISLKDATEGIAVIYQKGAATNAAVKDFPKFGIPVPTAGYPYNARVTTDANAMWGKNKVVTLTDRSQIATELMKSVVRQQVLPNMFNDNGDRSFSFGQ